MMIFEELTIAIFKLVFLILFEVIFSETDHFDLFFVCVIFDTWSDVDGLLTFAQDFHHLAFHIIIKSLVISHMVSIVTTTINELTLSCTDFSDSFVINTLGSRVFILLN